MKMGNPSYELYNMMYLYVIFNVPIYLSYKTSIVPNMMYIMYLMPHSYVPHASYHLYHCTAPLVPLYRTPCTTVPYQVYHLYRTYSIVNKTLFCLQYYGYGTDGTFGTVQMVQLVRCIGTRDTVQWYKGYVTRGAYGWYKGNCEYTICSTMCDRCVYSGHSYSGCRITGSPEYIDYCLLLFSLYIKTYRHMADLEKKSDVACFLYDILSSCAEIRCFFFVPCSHRIHIATIASPYRSAMNYDMIPI